MASLRKQVKDLKIGAHKRRQDFDPEDDAFAKQVESDDEDSQSGESGNENAGREHYETVNKSKLRRPEKTRLDEKKYGGQAVSRNTIFQDDDDADALAPEEDEDEDPFAAPVEDVTRSEDDGSGNEGSVLTGEDLDGEVDEDDEIDSDEAFEEGEEDKFRGKGFVFRGSGRDLERLPGGSEEDDISDDQSLSVSGGSEEDQSDIDMEDVDGEESDEDEDNLDSEDDEDEDESEDGEESVAHPRPSTIKQVGTTDREQLKALLSNDNANLASSLSASLSADVQKGTAVRKQYQTFDRLLDARIKLQKGLTLSNDLNNGRSIADEETQSALQKAEGAALKLYSTIESIRHTILETATSDQPSKKRKRPSPPTPTTSTSDLWTRISTLESSTVQTRRQTLDKWATKTRSATPISTTSKLNGTSTSETKLTSVLDAYLATEVPKHLSSPTPYDDSQFYQSLLRDLINSRSALSSNPQSNPLPLKLHPSGNTAKSSKVDTKASKGRKIRYTVHEKLENFMAGEGRGNAVGQWNDGAVREFFASLLGQRGLLGEDGDVGEDGDGDREVEALRLFSRV